MRAVSRDALIDVLVIGSGAAGLAAAVSAERAGARVALATKTTLQANNSSKAQGGIQASVGDDDSPHVGLPSTSLELVASSGVPKNRLSISCGSMATVRCSCSATRGSSLW